MKISASYWIFEGGLDGALPIYEAMEQAAQLGFDAIELGIASQGVLTHQTTQFECEAICAEAKKRIGNFRRRQWRKLGKFTNLE